MDNQEAFDRSVRHVMRQTIGAGNVVAIDHPKPAIECSYHIIQDGVTNTCGIGCLVDEPLQVQLEAEFHNRNVGAILREASRELAYHAGLPGVLPPSSVAVRFAAELAGVSDLLLSDLQGAHDSTLERGEYAKEQLWEKFKSLARYHGLKCDPSLKGEERHDEPGSV